MSEYCSILTQKLHVDGAGTAPPNTKYFLFVENEKPWDKNEKAMDEYPKFAFELAQGTIKIHFLAPDSFSKKGYKRILFFQVDPDNIGNFSRKEFSIPSSQRNELITSLFNNNESKFSQYQLKESNIRDIFICGHMNKDYCCGTFGNALYQATKKFLLDHQDEYSNVRVWQTTHLKGHKFAPTVIDFPEGRFWAHVTEDILFNQILAIETQGSLSNLKLHIRGLAGTNNYGQIAERELFLLHGPSWRHVKKTIAIVQNEELKDSATVNVTFEGPNGLETIPVTVKFLAEFTSVANHACGEISNFKKSEVEM